MSRDMNLDDFRPANQFGSFEYMIRSSNLFLNDDLEKSSLLFDDEGGTGSGSNSNNKLFLKPIKRNNLKANNNELQNSDSNSTAFEYGRNKQTQYKKNKTKTQGYYTMRENN